MLNRFQDYIKENNMLARSSRVLLAVSGGIDSMVMAHLFIEAGIDSGIAHCNFCLRGKESDLDEALVKALATQHNLPFYSERFLTKAVSRQKGISIQMAARELRYEWFEKILDQNGYDLVAIAHNLNDSIETLLINLTRGTGITGLTGIQPVSMRIIRPLLFATRNEISDYASSKGITFREDSSNSDTKYTRNKIRNLIIPVLKEINPSLEKTINETIRKLAESDFIISRYVTELREKISETSDNQVFFELSALKKLISNSTTMYELFRPYGLSGTQVRELSDVISGKTGGRIITSTHTILKDRKNLIVYPLHLSVNSNITLNNSDELKNIPGFISVLKIPVDKKFAIPREKNVACLDEDKIKYPLTYRKWEDGDSFVPLGMTNRKKISDFLVDNKISLVDKEKVMVLESDGKIVWLIGLRIDNRFRIAPATSRALIITVNG